MNYYTIVLLILSGMVIQIIVERIAAHVIMHFKLVKQAPNTKSVKLDNEDLKELEGLLNRIEKKHEGRE